MTRAVGVLALLVIASLARAEVVIDEEEIRAWQLKLSPDLVTSGRFAMVQATLPNDLGVLIVPDSSATSVVVHLRYESGAASELSGESGMTHVVEGLLGMASAHRTDFVARIEALGGWTTARAASDHLGTTTQVPAHALERVLWLEAERMAGLVDGIKPAWVDRAKERTQSAWRAAYVEAPYALVDRELSARMWPDRMAGFGQPVLGDGKTVQHVALPHLKAFVRRRVVPNNAMLVIAGPIDPKATRRLVDRYFGWMPPRDAVLRAENWLPMTRKAHATVKTPTRTVAVGYVTHPWNASLAVAARILAGDRESRLHRRLVDRGLASDVRAEIVHHKIAGDELRIYATPLPGIDPKRVASAIHDEAERLHSNVTDADVSRATALVELDFYLAAENLAVRAELLAATSHARAHFRSIFDWWPEKLRKLRANDMILLFDVFDNPVTVIGREDLR